MNLITNVFAVVLDIVHSWLHFGSYELVGVDSCLMSQNYFFLVVALCIISFFALDSQVMTVHVLEQHMFK